MDKVKFYKGTTANLPTSGMIEEGAFYLCTDTGKIYFGASTTSLLLLSEPKNEALGNGYAVCNTSSGTALTATLADYERKKNGIVAVLFNYAVPANATLNINDEGACSIMCRNRDYGGTIVSVQEGTIPAGSFALLFCYEIAQNTYGYLLVSQSTSNLVNAQGTSSLIGRNNPYGATQATGSNSLVLGTYLGTSSGDNALVAAATGNSTVTGSQGAILATNGGASVSGSNSAVIAGIGANAASNSAIIGSRSSSIAAKDAENNDVSQSVAIAGYSGQLNESQTLGVHNVKNSFGDKWNSSGITTKEGTTINSNIKAVGDITTTYVDNQSTWSYKAFNAIAAIVNGWFNDLNSKLYDWFRGVDESAKKVSIVKKIDVSILATTTLYTIPSGYVAVPLKSRATAMQLFECAVPQSSSASAYEDIAGTIAWTDEAGARSVTISGAIGPETLTTATTANSFIGVAGDITCQITTASTASAYMYVYFDFLLLPKNS